MNAAIHNHSPMEGRGKRKAGKWKSIFVLGCLCAFSYLTHHTVLALLSRFYKEGNWARSWFGDLPRSFS
jgi:hypothetical protein